MKSFCQMCGRKRNCALVDENTKGLHAKAKRKVTGIMAGTKLSVCRRCVKKGKL